MKLFLHALLAGLMAGAAALAQSPSQGSQPADTTVIALDSRSEARLDAGERVRVIVQFDLPQIAFDGLDRETRDAMRMEAIDQTGDSILVETFGASSTALWYADTGYPQHVRTFRYTPAMVLMLNSAELGRLRANPRVIQVQSDGLDRPHLNQTLQQIDVFSVHRAGLRGGNSVIAVLDTGIHYDHPAFEGRILDSACFSTTSSADSSTSLCINEASSDTLSAEAAQACETVGNNNECIHGTHVASIAAGAANRQSELGPYYLDGVAPESGLIPIQVFSSFRDPELCGSQLQCVLSYRSDQLAALEWLYNNRESTGLSVINMSLGGEVESGACPTDIRASIIATMRAQRIATVVATGNQGSYTGVSAPACIEETIAVAGVSSSNIQSGNSGYLTDVTAPNRVTAAGDPASGNLTLSLSGTSMAAPHVAGAVAVLMTEVPDATVDAIELALEQTGIQSFPAGHHLHPIIQVAPAYAQLAPDLIEVIEPPTRHFVRQFNMVGSDAPIPFQFRNTGDRSLAWHVETHRHDENHVSITGVDVQRDIFDRRLLSGTLAAGQTMTVWVRPVSLYADSDIGFDFIGGGIAYTGLVTFEVSYPEAPNDRAAAARHIDGHIFHITTNAALPSYEPGETEVADQPGSVWFTWRPGVSSALRLTGNGTLNLYTGSISDIGSLVPVGSSTGDARDTTISFVAEADQTYVIRLVPWKYPHENYVTIALESQFDGNEIVGDEVTRAGVLPGRSGLVAPSVLDIGGTTANEDDLYFVNGENYQAWFRWVAPYTGLFVLSDQHPYQPRTGFVNSFAVFHRRDGSSSDELGDPSGLERLAGTSLPSGEAYVAEGWPDRRLAVDVEEGRTYWIRVGATRGRQSMMFTYGSVDQLASRLFGSVLPERRSVRSGRAVTTFMTLINPPNQAQTATNCRIYAHLQDDSVLGRRITNLSYWLTDSQNQPVGPIDPSFNIPVGEARSLVLSVDPPLPTSRDVVFMTICDNVLPYFGDVDAFGKFSYTTANRPLSDIVSIAATPSADGILNVENGRTRAFSVAAVNIGDHGPRIRVEPRIPALTGTDRQPAASFAVEICETNPATGRCLTTRSATIDTLFETDAVKTFTVFVTTSGFGAYFSPRDFRVGVEFEAVSEEGAVETRRSATSVAVRLLGDQ
ncbi:S8 family peptidase [Hyphobacterium sp.]|uniref:S8 family peptidase n=1 Tax=Hyphobacterium sp. TaxID=2004662 RepID=UPI003BAC48A4